MVTLSSRQPLTLHHLGSSSGENADSSVVFTHYSPSRVTECSSAGTLFSWMFTFLDLSLSELQQGSLERCFGIAPALANKCMSYHHIFT